MSTDTNEITGASTHQILSSYDSGTYTSVMYACNGLLSWLLIINLMHITNILTITLFSRIS